MQALLASAEVSHLRVAPRASRAPRSGLRFSRASEWQFQCERWSPRAHQAARSGSRGMGALGGSRQSRSLVNARSVRRTGASGSVAVARAWLRFSNSLALRLRAAPGPRAGEGTGCARAGHFCVLRLSAVPIPGASFCCAKASATLCPNRSLQRTAFGIR